MKQSTETDESGERDDVGYELWINGHYSDSFDTIEKADRKAAERHPAHRAEIVRTPPNREPGASENGGPTGETVRTYPPVIDVE